MEKDEGLEFRPIRDYAIIGDAHTAALVSSAGSVDWCCWPNFDSPAVFCRLLDRHKGGWFRVGPAGEHLSSRCYIEQTNVLVTTFATDAGQCRLTDFMPVEELTASHLGEDIASKQRILRLVEGLSGEVELEISFRPTFDYARAEAAFDRSEHRIIARTGHEALVLDCGVPLQHGDSGALVGRTKIRAGQRLWLALSYVSGETASPTLPAIDCDAELQRTLAYWRQWSGTCTYQGPYAQMVRRSALVLKLLTYEPTGALVAAPTTSLPEQVGGLRNWDYRYTWLRDSSLILYALQLLGYYEEATDFFGWLDRLCIPCGHELQIMYRIDGGDELPEHTLDDLEGYRRSRPVRIGNGAYRQQQLDVYGEVLDAAHLHHEGLGQPVSPQLWQTLSYLADQTARRWREKDSGIWEVRGGPRHFLYSKLLSWVALDRAIRLARRENLPGDVNGWSKSREAIRHAILTEGYDEKLGAFTQSFGEPVLDASALVIPQVGFLPATDPRVRSTVEKIRGQLTAHGLVYRYNTDVTADGLQGTEGTFALCSFWMVDNLAQQGRVDEARTLFEKIIGYANDLGLLSEEIEPTSNELLGNFPQGFTHLGLIRSALNIARAETHGPEEQAQGATERANKIEKAGHAQAPSSERLSRITRAKRR
jgi:alpha,alpha-trehalase